MWTPPSARGWASMAELIGDAAEVFLWGPSQRQALAASAPEQLTAALNPRLREAGWAVLLTWPTLGRYEWPSVLEAVGVQAEPPARALQEVLLRAAEAFERLPRDLRVALGALLGAEAWPPGLPRPEEVASPSAALALLARLIGHKGPPRKSEPEPSLAEDLPALVEGVFSPGGALSQAHPRFEFRATQQQMAVACAEALVREEVLVAEAGTGTGKSLAYLVPAALWAMAGQSPVVIATCTRNLQDQLAEQEVPIVRRALGGKLTATVVKGRSNYACLRLAFGLLEDVAMAVMPDERLLGGFLASWLVQDDYGDLEGLSPELAEFLPGLRRAIEAVRAHHYRCIKAAPGGCPYSRLCALQRLKTSASRSHLIITNQAMLLADVTHDVLPDYRDLVIDEAHHLEETATGALLVEITATSLLQRAEHLGGEGDSADVPTALTRALRVLEGPDEHYQAQVAYWREVADQWVLRVEALEAAVLKLLRVNPQRPPEDPKQVRVTEEVWYSEAWRAVDEALGDLDALARDAAERLETLATELAELARAEGKQEEISGPVGDLLATVGSLGDVAEAIEQVTAETPGYVVWAEARAARSGRGPGELRWALYSAPVDVAEALNEMLLDRCRSLVLTGATLSTEGSFDFFRLQCGLDLQAHRLVELALPSPFDWARQLLVCLPTDLPDPRDSRHADAVIEVLARLARLSGGGVLGLFTARQRMLRAYEQLAPRIKKLGLTLLAQDVSGERWWLLEQMRADPSTVLLGVRSLWEGVDVPGHHLRCVVLEKLPFAVPDDPLVAARMEYLQRLGLEPYNHYYVPQALRIMRQGVGRLIRTANDRGVVFVLDPRVHRRSYGRRFVRSLPPGRQLSASVDECLATTARWLAEGEEL
ncbi:MAG: hypothetical protein J7M26_06860 [Armatimonadetes bacterium]|nr:hypothetical protein [Armatimonadota bacterium]